MSEDAVFEVLSRRDNGRGYHTAEYAITADTHEQAVELAKKRWANSPPVLQWYVSSKALRDGRWHCMYSFDSGD